MIKKLKIGFLIGLCLGINVAFGQNINSSPDDMYGAFLEKKSKAASSSSKVINAKDQEELDQLEKLLKDNANNSFEYHLVKYINGNYDLSLSNHLFEAAKLKPDDARLNRELFGYYAITGNLEKQKELANTIRGQFSANTLAYYQYLFSGKNNGIFLFSSDEDTYPALILQSQGKISKDITIVNMDFLQNDDYRKKIQNQLGGMNVTFLGNERAFIAAMFKSNAQRIYISTTVSQAYLSNDLFITGLTYERAISDQQKVLEGFWNSVQAQIAGLNLTTSSDKSLYSNFLPPLLTLYKLKMIHHESDDKLKGAILLLAKKLNKEKLVTTIITAYEKRE